MPIKTGFPSIDKTHLEGISPEELDPEIHSWSMYKTFLYMNKGFMNETAVYDSTGEHSKTELVDNIKRYASAMIAAKVIPGRSKIFVAMANSFEMVSVVMAANSIGVKVFFLNYLDSDSELLEKFKSGGATLLFKAGEVYRFGSTTNAESTEAFLANGDGVTYLQRAIKAMDRFSDYDDEPTIFLQTSGSTSVPKILPFKNSAIYATMLFALHSTRIENHDPVNRKLMTILSARLPFGFMTGFIPILWGQEVVFASGARPEDIAQYYKYNAFLIFGTPVLLQAMMKLTPKDADLSSLKRFYSSGLSTPEDLYPAAAEFFRAHNCTAKICNNYGFGEGLGIGTASDTVEHLPGTSGKFYIGPNWCIVDDNMCEVKYGESGELIVNSPTLCEGYFNNPEATAEAFIVFRDKTYFKTGDYVSVDEAGYVRYLGRKKRFFQPTGADDKVSCEMIEKCIYELDFIEQAAVIPVTVEGATVGRAFISLKDNSILNKCEVESIVKQHFCKCLKKYQIPANVVVLDKLPIMASGKIDYRLLAKL